MGCGGCPTLEVVLEGPVLAEEVELHVSADPAVGGAPIAHAMLSTIESDSETDEEDLEDPDDGAPSALPSRTLYRCSAYSCRQPRSLSVHALTLSLAHSLAHSSDCLQACTARATLSASSPSQARAAFSTTSAAASSPRTRCC